ncbi:MAG: DUF1330 domain-containing protein [Bacteroidota bacterium]
MRKYIDATPGAGKRFYQDFKGKGKVVMLNMLKFRVTADYSDLDHLRTDGEISGEEAYQLYMDFTFPLLKKAGSRVLFIGKAHDFLIGPIDEQWDLVILVEHESAEKFVAFARDLEYLKTAGHRKAALEDSRLLPLLQT